MNKLGTAGDDVRPRRDEAGRHRRIKREHLVLLRLREENVFHLLHLVGIFARYVFALRPVFVRSNSPLACVPCAYGYRI